MMNPQIREGYMALTVSILAKTTPEQAFERLGVDHVFGIKHVPRSISDVDTLGMMEMRDKGATWREIGEVFGVGLHTAVARVKRYKGG